jgi:hypothetical protein
VKASEQDSALWLQFVCSADAARKKFVKRKFLLAMKFEPDIKGGGGASPGTRSRSYEDVGKTPFVYPYLERLFGVWLDCCHRYKPSLGPSGG